MADKKEGERKIDTGGGAYFEGSINTGGGDFVGRDQTKVTMGNVSGSTVVVGSHNTVSGGVQAGASVAELASLVAEIRALLPQAGLDEDTQQVVEGSFRVVEEQLKKPEPKKALVLPGLKQIAETLALAVTAGEAAGKLRPMLEQAVVWAQALLK
jgi:hypothetical protein